jgi:hypothetical protein
MIKGIFGWLIAVCRRWAVGSSYKNKTSRAKCGLSLICSLYIMGSLLNIVLMIEPEFPSWMPYELFMVLIVAIWVAPLILLVRIYPNSTSEIYIKKYHPKGMAQNIKQQLLAFAFCLGGFFIMFGPLLIYPSLFGD